MSAAKKPVRNRTKDTEALAQDVIEPEPEPIKRLNANIPQSLHTAFKQRTAGEGLSMGKKLIELLEDYVQSSDVI